MVFCVGDAGEEKGISWVVCFGESVCAGGLISVAFHM